MPGTMENNMSVNCGQWKGCNDLHSLALVMNWLDVAHPSCQSVCRFAEVNQARSESFVNDTATRLARWYQQLALQNDAWDGHCKVPRIDVVKSNITLELASQ